MKSVLNTNILQILILLLCFACDNNRNQSEKPNIILIYADDLGIGLLSHEGQEIIKTPNIDKLAREGIRFQRAYSNMLCAPARASLITGLHDCHKNRFQITEGSAYINAGKSTLDEIENTINESLLPITNEQVFLGEVAQSMGYKTAQFGKLEWGFSSTNKQLKQHGWDYYLGYLRPCSSPWFLSSFFI